MQFARSYFFRRYVNGDQCYVEGWLYQLDNTPGFSFSSVWSNCVVWADWENLHLQPVIFHPMLLFGWNDRKSSRPNMCNIFSTLILLIMFLIEHFCRRQQQIVIDFKSLLLIIIAILIVQLEFYKNCLNKVAEMDLSGKSET